MTEPHDLILALETPAALLGADGRLILANAAFQVAGMDAIPPRALGLDEHRETLGPDGGLIAWKLTPLPDGRRLLSGRPVAGGGRARERYFGPLSHQFPTPP